VVNFFRQHNIALDTIRKDNQSSSEVRQAALELDLQWELAERAIRTEQNHMISVRAGFDPACPDNFLDKCLFQIEMTLNTLHPFEMWLVNASILLATRSLTVPFLG
jgi:hypothetical protein